jgi:hypothetical protein
MALAYEAKVGYGQQPSKGYEALSPISRRRNTHLRTAVKEKQ